LDLAPGALEGAPRGSHRAIDVLGIALRDRREQFAGRGIERLERLAGSGVHPFAVDEHFLVGTIRIRMARDRNRLRHSHVILPWLDRYFGGSLYSRLYNDDAEP